MEFTLSIEDRDRIYKKDDKGRYIYSPSERQELIRNCMAAQERKYKGGE